MRQRKNIKSNVYITNYNNFYSYNFIKKIKNKKNNKILGINPITVFKNNEEIIKDNNDYDTPHFSTIIES